MAKMIMPRNPKSVARAPIGVLRTEYNNLASDYTDVVNGENYFALVVENGKRLQLFTRTKDTQRGIFIFVQNVS